MRNTILRIEIKALLFREKSATELFWSAAGPIELTRFVQVPLMLAHPSRKKARL
jgi:hypothetical protein